MLSICYGLDMACPQGLMCWKLGTAVVMLTGGTIFNRWGLKGNHQAIGLFNPSEGTEVVLINSGRGCYKRAQLAPLLSLASCLTM